MESRVTLEDLDSIRKRLQVEVPAGVVQQELDRTFDRVGQRARLPGFRPGKAPRRVLERVFGEDVRREVVAHLVEESFREAIDNHGLAIVGTPDIDVDLSQLAPGAPLRYSATVEVRPAIVLGALTGLEAVRPGTAIVDDDVERALTSLRESAGQLRPIEDRVVVEAGDVVRVDLGSRIDGGESSRKEGVLIEAGAGTFPLALERQLVGQHLGARLALRVPYPADYPNAGLAGKTAEFDVEIKELRAKELPALDDEFARDHGRCQSLEELRARIRTDLEREAVARADDAVRDAILQQLVARHPFDVPPSLVERRTEALLGALRLDVPAGTDRDRALASVRVQLRPRAEEQVRAELLLDAVAAKEGIAASDDDVETEIAELASRERRVVEQVRAFYERPETRAALRAKIARDRALAGLIACARVMPSSAAESVAHEK